MKIFFLETLTHWISYLSLFLDSSLPSLAPEPSHLFPQNIAYLPKVGSHCVEPDFSYVTVFFILAVIF